MREVIRKAIVDTLGREHWIVLAGHATIRYDDQQFPIIHAMMTGGVVCWWHLDTAEDRDALHVRLTLEYHGCRVWQECTLGAEIAKHIRDIPQAMQREARRLLDHGSNWLDIGNDMEARYINMARDMATEWVPILSRHFRDLLRATLEEARRANRDQEYNMAHPAGRPIDW